MHLKIGVALCPPTSQRTAQPWPESPLSIIAPMHSILRVRLIIGDDHGDSDSDGDDTGGDNDDDDDVDDCFEDFFVSDTLKSRNCVKKYDFLLRFFEADRYLTCLCLWIYVHCVCGYHILVEKSCPDKSLGSDTFCDVFFTECD